MTIQVGEQMPALTLKTMGSEGPEDVHTVDLLQGKKVVLFAVPGAFTPGCSNTHMPGFVVHADAILGAGIDQIICTSVNDAFVMKAWQDAQNAESIFMLADGSAELAEALGLELDATSHGLGVRSRRYAMIINDGVVEYLGVDEKTIEHSSAEAILKQLA